MSRPAAHVEDALEKIGEKIRPIVGVSLLLAVAWFVAFAPAAATAVSGNESPPLKRVAATGGADDAPSKASAADVENPGDAPADLYDRAKKAAVEILVDDHLSGSGWLADAEGIVVTAAHVIGHPKRRIEVLWGEDRLKAEVVAVDGGFDLALLKVKPPGGRCPALPVAENFGRAGQSVYLFGAPMYRHRVMLRGMIARNDTSFEYYSDRRQYIEMVHVAATVQINTSGAPWLDARGNVVGMQSGMMMSKGVAAGVSFMIPASAIRALLAARTSAATATLSLAVEETWQQPRSYLDQLPPRTEGLVVRVLPRGGPGDRAGVRQGDIITAVDGRKVRFPDELLRAVRAKQPGDVVRLHLMTPGKPEARQVSVTLGKIEAPWSPEK